MRDLVQPVAPQVGVVVYQEVMEVLVVEFLAQEVVIRQIREIEMKLLVHMVM